VGGWVHYRLVSELLVETQGWYGLRTIGQGIMVKKEYVFEILNLRRDSIAEITQKPERRVDRDPL
jgi:hypothetical protein